VAGGRHSGLEGEDAGVFNKEAVQVLLEKVPDLRVPWKVLLTVLYTASLGCLCGLFFHYVDRQGGGAPLISQGIMALLTAAISWLHFRLAGWYRDRYGPLAYRAYFYHLMLPYLVAWYACFFHPLFIGGPALLPPWLAISLGVLLLLLVPITSVHIERAGFHMETHGLDVYTIFPEETQVVRGEIYAYIRHPLYFALSCGTFGLAILANNWVALGAALLQLIPALLAGWMEDRELVERDGAAHQEYVGMTGALLPRKDFGGFLRMLFVGLFAPGQAPTE
jgi:protein-S-isoprenylcysteine O-methyltransferase Ste14